ncbi:MAG: FkbM family methyltransferase, partial [Tunicatimonas sp.]
LQDGDVVLDIGANIGWYSLLLERNSPPSVRIYAFEPDPLNYRLLTTNAQLNHAHKITGVPMALSDKAETKTLYLYPNKNRGRHSLIPLAKGDGETVQVTTTTLNDFVNEYTVDPARVKFIKMDVEGYEYHVLRGGSRLLETVPFVHTEFWPPYFRRGKVDQKGLVDLMRSYQYQPQIIDERGDLYEIPYETLITLEQGVNILWVKKGQMV